MTIYLFRDQATKKWAFRWNVYTFWTNYDIKQPVELVQKVVKQMNPQYDIVLAN